MEQLHRMATRIQSMARMTLVQWHLDDMEDAAETLQRVIRGHQARQHLRATQATTGGHAGTRAKATDTPLDVSPTQTSNYVATEASSALDAATLDAAALDAATLDVATLDAATLDAATLDAATLDAATLDAAADHSHRAAPLLSLFCKQVVGVCARVRRRRLQGCLWLWRSHANTEGCVRVQR